MSGTRGSRALGIDSGASDIGQASSMAWAGSSTTLATPVPTEIRVPGDRGGAPHWRALARTLHTRLATTPHMPASARDAKPWSASTGMDAAADVLQALLHLCDDHGARAAACATRARAHSRAPGVTYAATVFCRLARWQMGDMAAFVAMGRATAPSGANTRIHLIAQMDRAIEAIVEMRQLRLPMAARLSRDVLEAAGPGAREGAVSLLGRIVLAQLAYEHGDVIEAETAIRPVLARARSGFFVEPAIAAYVTLVRAAIRRRHCEFASTILHEGEALGGARGWPRLAAACLVEHIDLMLALGRDAEAERLFQRLALLAAGDHGTIGDIALSHGLARGRMLARSGEGQEEITSYRRLLSTARANGDALLAVRLQLRLGAALARLGDVGAAGEIVGAALRVGCDAGLYRTILDADAEVRGVLLTIQPRLRPAHLRAYVTTLVEHWPEPPGDATRKGEKRAEGPLTCRERTVLQLMSHGHSNKLIARRLGIAPETVKSHAKNIFVRLGSCTRTEAVSRAVSLGMI